MQCLQLSCVILSIPLCMYQVCLRALKCSSTTGMLDFCSPCSVLPGDSFCSCCSSPRLMCGRDCYPHFQTAPCTTPDCDEQSVVGKWFVFMINLSNKTTMKGEALFLLLFLLQIVDCEIHKLPINKQAHINTLLLIPASLWDIQEHHEPAAVNRRSLIPILKCLPIITCAANYDFLQRHIFYWKLSCLL